MSDDPIYLLIFLRGFHYNNLDEDKADEITIYNIFGWELSRIKYAIDKLLEREFIKLNHTQWRHRNIHYYTVTEKGWKVSI